jgi:hypothetical protein
MPATDELRGLWCRTMYRRRWRRRERDLAVFWLQGPRLFADLRQPQGQPDFTGIRCLRDLGDTHLDWMARQHGFAGSLTVRGDTAEWHRAVDFQPGDGVADRARIRLDGATLREAGTEARYRETWVRDRPPAAPCWGLRLADDDTGRNAFLVRVGADFMFARGRPAPLYGAGGLARLMAATPCLAARQDLADCEISLGRVDAETGAWRIARSTLPYREGAGLTGDPAGPASLRLDEIDPAGAPVSRLWRIAEADDEGWRGSLPG